MTDNPTLEDCTMTKHDTLRPMSDLDTARQLSADLLALRDNPCPNDGGYTLTLAADYLLRLAGRCEAPDTRGEDDSHVWRKSAQGEHIEWCSMCRQRRALLNGEWVAAPMASPAPGRPDDCTDTRGEDVAARERIKPGLPGVMPRYFGVWSSTGAHIGVWEDGALAESVRSEYPGGTIIEMVDVMNPVFGSAALTERGS